MPTVKDNLMPHILRNDGTVFLERFDDQLLSKLKLFFIFPPLSVTIVVDTSRRLTVVARTYSLDSETTALS